MLIFSLTLLVCRPAGSREITGTVTDGSAPFPGVNVVVKGTSRGTQTDFDGNYKIEVSEGDVLVFSYVGYATREIPVGTASRLDVVLQEDYARLDEVIVTGMHTKRTRHATAAVQSVSADYDVLPSAIAAPPNNYAAYEVLEDRQLQSESYARIEENQFRHVALSPLSTFSIDVDRAAYSNIRRMINNGQSIPKDAVKIEEMVNYFPYDYPQPGEGHPFSIQTDMAATPWNPDTRLVRIGIQGKDLRDDALPPSNLTFLIDVSGSMDSPDKLPLLKSAFKLLVGQLREQDRVAIVVYAGAAGVVLPPTRGHLKEKILAALNDLEAGGSTAGGEGIKLAYKLAEKHFVSGGNNRVILATDGDFNVGASSDRAMEDLIAKKRDSGIFLSVLGFGMGNYKDSKLEILADKGNGNHAYIDTMQEAQKVFGTEFGGTLFTIAKDVKIQVEFNPAYVAGYRLLGYENRMLADQDFRDDSKDAGELGSNHSVTALYEILPAGKESPFLSEVDKLTYTQPVSAFQANGEWMKVRFRYKKPAESRSIEIVKVVQGESTGISGDFSFASSVALFGMHLRNSEFANGAGLAKVIELAENGRGADPDGYRAEFIRLVKSASGKL